MNSFRATVTAPPKTGGTCDAVAPRARTLLLVIDPDPQADTLVDDFGDRLDVRVSGSAAEGLLMAGAMRPDVVLLRADLRDVPAPTVVHLLDRCCEVPVIVAVDGDHGELAGAALEAGAVACVARPYRAAQLMSLITAVRPTPPPSEDAVLTCGVLQLSPAAQTVHLRGVLIPLPPQEFRLLRFLMTNEGRVVSQARLWEAVWGGTAPSASNTVSVHVRRLRSRLGDDPRRPRLIATVGRSGYLLQAPPD
jgi:DNA-binding response OmpR family regulator